MDALSKAMHEISGINCTYGSVFIGNLSDLNANDLARIYDQKTYSCVQCEATVKNYIIFADKPNGIKRKIT